MDYDNLCSEFDLPANPAKITRENHRGPTITVEATDESTAAKVMWDIETAINHGAFPAAHEVIINHLNEANKKEMPLAIRLAL